MYPNAKIVWSEYFFLFCSSSFMQCTFRPSVIIIIIIIYTRPLERRFTMFETSLFPGGELLQLHDGWIWCCLICGIVVFFVGFKKPQLDNSQICRGEIQKLIFENGGA